VRLDSAALTIENTGRNLAPEVVATLAEPFRRGTERIRTDHAGVGLGLAIVRSIAEAHDGNLTLAPRAAGGLRVTVQLPIGPATAAPECEGVEEPVRFHPAAVTGRSQDR